MKRLRVHKREVPTRPAICRFNVRTGSNFKNLKEKLALVTSKSSGSRMMTQVSRVPLWCDSKTRIGSTGHQNWRRRFWEIRQKSIYQQCPQPSLETRAAISSNNHYLWTEYRRKSRRISTTTRHTSQVSLARLQIKFLKTLRLRNLANRIEQATQSPMDRKCLGSAQVL